MLSSPIKSYQKRVEGVGWREQQIFQFFLERERLLSSFPANPTVGSLRDKKESCSSGAGYAWTPDLRSFDKLLEVGVSPYLGFILRLSTMLMFRLVEALNGRLIGPKPWDRIDIIFGAPNRAAVN